MSDFNVDDAEKALHRYENHVWPDRPEPSDADAYTDARERMLMAFKDTIAAFRRQTVAATRLAEAEAERDKRYDEWSAMAEVLGHNVRLREAAEARAEKAERQPHCALCEPRDLSDPDKAQQEGKAVGDVVRVIQFGRDRYEWRLPEITGGELRRLCNIPGGDDVFRLEPSQDWTQHVGPPIEYDEIIPLPQMPPPMQASLRIVAIPRFIDGGFADRTSAK